MKIRKIMIKRTLLLLVIASYTLHITPLFEIRTEEVLKLYSEIKSWFQTKRTKQHATLLSAENKQQSNADNNTLAYLQYDQNRTNKDIQQLNQKLLDIYWWWENIKIDQVEELLNQGADINCKDNEGTPLFHHVVRGGNIELINLFIKRGVNIH